MPKAIYIHIKRDLFTKRALYSYQKRPTFKTTEIYNHTKRDPLTKTALYLNQKKEDRHSYPKRARRSLKEPNIFWTNKADLIVWTNQSPTISGSLRKNPIYAQQTRLFMCSEKSLVCSEKSLVCSEKRLVVYPQKRARCLHTNEPHVKRFRLRSVWGYHEPIHYSSEWCIGYVYDNALCPQTLRSTLLKWVLYGMYVVYGIYIWQCVRLSGLTHCHIDTLPCIYPIHHSLQ